MRLLVCGPRNLTEAEHGHQLRLALFQILTKAAPYASGFVFGHSAALGADMLWEDALVWCYSQSAGLWMPIHREPARWGELGNAAGPIRNQRLLERIRPTRWLAAHWDTEPSTPGTGDMVRRLRSAGVPGEVVPISKPAKHAEPRKRRSKAAPGGRRR